MYSIKYTFWSKSLQKFIVFRAQKDGSADRSWFCELYDGEATAGVKASNDVKRITVEVGSYALSIGGFHQPQPFLMEQSDLKLRRDGFMERFLLCCPFPKKMMHEEVISANDNLRSNYSPDVQSFKKLLEQIFNYNVFESRQYRYFFSCLFTGACGEHARGSFLYDHYIQVVIKRKKGITVVVRNW